MSTEASVRSTDPALEALQALDARALATLDRAALARHLAPVIERLRRPMAPEQSQAFSQAALSACQLLHLRARSREGLSLLYALLDHARAAGDRLLERRASSACGIHCADAGDPVAAVAHQVDALRLAGDDRVATSRAWNNIGLAMLAAGHSTMATRAYERALGAVEGTNAADVRYAVLGNLAQSFFDNGSYEEGLVYANLALAAERGMVRCDPMAMLRVRRNIVRLLVAVGRVEDAEPHVLDAGLLAQQINTPRASIAAALTRAVYDLALGNADVGLTRLDAALTAAREVPGALRDALACVVRAEEMAGNSERALLRLSELSDVVYGSAVAAVRQHIELACIADREGAVAIEDEQARARLISKLATPVRPDGWIALERLGIAACIRIEPTGLHGKRVGALAKALALASGCGPLHALEIGLACELHDIGMVSVPEELIAKRGLPEGERAIIERHVRAGAEILSDDRHTRIFLAREVVRYHHAHWDGTGHPEGVAGTRIPLAARICAIADAYDDLVCGAHAAPRRTMDEALRHLRAEAGKRYDPGLVHHFESMIRAETDDLGLDLSAAAGMDNFQQLVSALQEDRGFV
jgi:putative two-component system response regulator